MRNQKLLEVTSRPYEQYAQKRKLTHLVSLLITVTSGEMLVLHEPVGPDSASTRPYPCNLSALATLLTDKPEECC